MAETTIEWTATRGPDGTMHKGFTHNAWIGCEEVDPDPEHPGGPSECDNCYARRGSARLGAQHHLQLWPKEPGGPSDRFFTGADYQKRPYAWNRKAAKLGVRLKVFAASYSDVAEDREDLVERRTQLGRTILETPTPACCWFRASRCVRCPSDAPRCEHGPDRWRSPLYMPRWASRILLALTSVRVERLQSITAADAAAEGMTCPSCGHPEVDKTCGYCDDFRDKHRRPPLVEAYAKTWDAIHARGDPAHAWSASPWVWVLSFRRLT